jgi:hypothetical protein
VWGVGCRGASMNIRIAMAAPCLLSGCSDSERLNEALASRTYVRTDGHPIDGAQAQAVLAQCQGESARTVQDQVDSDELSRSSKQNTITYACMARNGYLAQ